MRKFYTLLAAVVTTATFAQEVTPLNVNGSLENWENPNESPAGWFLNGGLLTSGNIAKVSDGNAQDGDNYLSINSHSETNENYNAGMADFGITSGETYSFSYWYKSESSTFNFTHWVQWRTAASGGQAIGDNNTPFRPHFNERRPASVGEWTYVIVSETAPAAAQGIRGAFRNYDNSSVAYIDNVVVALVDPASTKDNSIEGLSIYPNPANDLVHIGAAELGIKNVTIFDLVGKKVLSIATEQTVNVAGLEAGVYVINIEQNGKTASRKLVIK